MNKDTVIRTVVLALALINQVLESTGHSVIPISDDQVTEIISLTFTICASVWAWWKNNSFTASAKEADRFLKALKERNKNESVK